MGISPTPEVFQWKLNQELEGFPSIKIVADDILVIGKGDDKEKVIHDHDAKLQQLLNRCQERNIKLNSDKIQLRRMEVPYFGHLLSSEGLRPDPEKKGQESAGETNGEEDCLRNLRKGDPLGTYISKMPWS
ncbi:hypothetical protein Y1Q_0012546 [Alligator mississippiensis]|uniref:Reverse transcriptase domain-containing protein n=1 Tax=Alligator mississippiensis TaxID=8496 RepID=A0A151M818_ALLMI|nr:hypothetical protein Y1Q_0012546 [Alligator mississippiensis]